jgi:hypothetical protein
VALILPGPLVSDIRGKVGDVVFERNATGLYVRSKGIVTQETSDRREAAIDALTGCSQYWQQHQTDAMIAAWTAYANLYPTRNTWGERRHHKAQHVFIRNNFHSWLAWQELWTEDPPERAPLPPSSFNAWLHYEEHTIEIPMPPELWPAAPGIHLLTVYQGKPVLATRNTFSGPWAWAGYYYESASTWTLTHTVAEAFVVPPGYTSWIRIVVNGWDPVLESRRCTAKGTRVA